MIELKSINKYYQSEAQSFHALKHISLKVERGESVAIIGSSGSGKSTMMNIIGCLDLPSTGEYWLNGENVAGFNERQLADTRNHTIGFVFQNFHLLPRMNILENVVLPLAYQRIPTKQRKEQAVECLVRVGLQDKLNMYPNQLSGGQRQRVAVARALVAKPKLILADEPTGNLDSNTTEDIMQLFEQLHSEGHTLLIITHEKEIADRCARAIRLQDGELVEDRLNSTVIPKVIACA
ncbi:ABC transporter ATP-binding protein [Pleionea sediminis]|uniref:ABC transporter ATP-binding protein n=1 Tax=Pleionea sediminis TaxID=2569479 RepID=UPI001184BF8D|nr:ABC transporter ATP-binding protein [Pleionea sediminis]